jgi:hypothetical protein
VGRWRVRKGGRDNNLLHLKLQVNHHPHPHQRDIERFSLTSMSFAPCLFSDVVDIHVPVTSQPRKIKAAKKKGKRISQPREMWSLSKLE